MEIAATMYDTNVLGFKGPRRMTGCYHCHHHFLDNCCYRDLSYQCHYSTQFNHIYLDQEKNIINILNI